MTIFDPPSSNDPLVVQASAAVQTNQGFQPPPPPPMQSSNPWGSLPEGWTVVASPQDGRIYYWERSTGKTQWTHPLATPVSPESMVPMAVPPPTTGRSLTSPFSRQWNMFSNRAEYHDTPWNATRRPNNQQCYAITALLLCFPVGLCALYQSVCVDRAWSDGRYGDAVNHSRQASQYACMGTVVGAIFWLWYFFAEELRRIPEWFQFD